MFIIVKDYFSEFIKLNRACPIYYCILYAILIFLIVYLKLIKEKIALYNLELAVMCKPPEEVKIALKKVRNLNQSYKVKYNSEKHDMTIMLRAAANTKYPEVIKLLIENGAIYKTEFSDGNVNAFALNTAILSNQNPEVFKEFLRLDITLKNEKQGLDAYSNAIFNKNPKVIEEVLKVREFRKILFSDKFKNAYTIPLILTSPVTTPDKIEAVLSSGIDVNSPNEKGKTAYDYIIGQKRNIHPEIMEIFFKYFKK